MSSAYPDLADVNGISGIAGAMNTFAGPQPHRYVTRYRDSTANLPDHQATYAMYRALVDNNNPYRELKGVMESYGLGSTAMQGLRNPANAICAFYEATLWPGTIREDDGESALPLRIPEEAQDVDQPQADALRDAIHQTWRDSNFNAMKDTLAYECAALGDVFYKVRSQSEGENGEPARAWFETVLPDYVTETETDGRGYLVYIRLDVPQRRRLPNGTSETYTHTEIWDKGEGTYRVWKHDKRGVGVGTIVSIDDLGPPDEALDIEQAFGFDFVPFVHWRWDQRSDDERGVSALARSLDKIIYGDALDTALHQRLTRYNLPDMALISAAFDKAGDPLNPPQIQTDTDGNLSAVTLNDGTLWVPPPGYTLEHLIADLHYAEHLAVVEAHYKALMQSDAPELAWYTISEAGDMSGRALDYRLTPAKAKVEKARGRAEDCLIRITQMTLSVAQQVGAAGFSVEEIGTYADNGFDFWIDERPIVPMSRLDDIAVEQARASLTKTLTDAGASVDGAVKVAGYSKGDTALLTRDDFAPGELEPEPRAVPPAVPATNAPGIGETA